VRTYLGARTLVRLLRSYATRWEKRQFLKSCGYEIPLEFLAIVLGREGWMTLGRWTYPEFVRAFFIDRHASLRAPAEGAAARVRWAATLLVLAPIDLLYVLPRAVLHARRRGRLDQFGAYLRGLRDGLLNRPVPLERLGLR
jgi:hypothetical protein